MNCEGRSQHVGLKRSEIYDVLRNKIKPTGQNLQHSSKFKISLFKYGLFNLKIEWNLWERNLSEYLGSLLTLYFKCFRSPGNRHCNIYSLIFSYWFVSSLLKHLYVHEWLKAPLDRSTSLAVNVFRKILVNSIFQIICSVFWKIMGGCHANIHSQ